MATRPEYSLSGPAKVRQPTEDELREEAALEEAMNDTIPSVDPISVSVPSSVPVAR
jgi:hypothetical protein